MNFNKTPLYYAVDKQLNDVVKVLISSEKIDVNTLNIFTQISNTIYIKQHLNTISFYLNKYNSISQYFI